MKTYISILRGINVSGQKLIKMDKLKQEFISLGFKDVRTYIQSGNIIFNADPVNENNLEKAIGEKIMEAFGFEVPVLVKDVEEIRSVLLNNPFAEEKDKAFLHVTFLSAVPSGENIDMLESQSFAPDIFVIKENAVYLFCPNGYGKTKLSNNFFENKLKVKATTRNWSTLNELYSLAKENG